MILENFGAVLHNLKLSKRGRIIINYVLHKIAETDTESILYRDQSPLNVYARLGQVMYIIVRLVIFKY